LNKYVIYGILLASGVLLGVFFCNYSYFIFDKVIKITDLVYWLITSTVGLYIAINVNKAFQKNHSEKEIIITEIKGILEQVNKVVALINNNRLPLQETKNQFKRINENLGLVETLIEESHCSGLSIAHLKKELYQLRRLILDISPVEDFITPEPIVSKKIFKSANDLKGSLYRFIFAVNKC